MLGWPCVPVCWVPRKGGPWAGSCGLPRLAAGPEVEPPFRPWPLRRRLALGSGLVISRSRRPGGRRGTRWAGRCVCQQVPAEPSWAGDGGELPRDSWGALGAWGWGPSKLPTVHRPPLRPPSGFLPPWSPAAPLSSQSLPPSVSDRSSRKCREGPPVCPRWAGAPGRGAGRGPGAWPSPPSFRQRLPSPGLPSSAAGCRPKGDRHVSFFT